VTKEGDYIQDSIEKAKEDQDIRRSPKPLLRSSRPVHKKYPLGHAGVVSLLLAIVSVS
jgi:hypothetical protein